jgi:NAD-reducing hydrogenase large subunit
MKFPYLRALGRDAGWYRVGPLARVQNCRPHPQRRAPRCERQRFLSTRPGVPMPPWPTHWARMIEMLHAVEVIAELLHDGACAAAR